MIIAVVHETRGAVTDVSEFTHSYVWCRPALSSTRSIEHFFSRQHEAVCSKNVSCLIVSGSGVHKTVQNDKLRTGDKPGMDSNEQTDNSEEMKIGLTKSTVM